MAVSVQLKMFRPKIIPQQLFSSRGGHDRESVRESIDSSVRVSSIGGNSGRMDILDWAWDEDVMAVLGLLQLNKLSISGSGSINSLESCGLISEGLLGYGGDSVDSSQPIASIQELGGAMGSNSKSRENNQELHIGLVRSELIPC